jgi:hypothetical protein
MMYVFKRPSRSPDLEVELTLFTAANGGRTLPLLQGCRLPNDFGLPGELNDGMYEFLGDPPSPGCSQKAVIWLLAPERNEGRLSSGFEFRPWERGFIGVGKITRVINPMLNIDAEPNIAADA